MRKAHKYINRMEKSICGNKINKWGLKIPILYLTIPPTLVGILIPNTKFIRTLDLEFQFRSF